MIQQNQGTSINLRMLIFTFLMAAALIGIAINKINIDFDVLNSLPSDNPIISDAKYILAHHPFQDRVVIDIGIENNDREILVEAAQLVEEELNKSGLFKQVGLKNVQLLIPKLVQSVSKNLPYLFSYSDLTQNV